MSEEQNGWNEWSKHILKELERLNDNYESLRNVNEEIKAELTRVSSVKSEVGEIKVWKTKIDEVLSPTQLKELSDDVQKLKTFKTVAVTVWLVVQFLTTVAFGVLNFL